MKIFTNKKFREYEVEKRATINELRDTISNCTSYEAFLEEKQEKIRDMLYEIIALRKTNIAKTAIFTKINNVIGLIEKKSYTGGKK